MTDAMLRLARAVYGEAAHVGPHYDNHLDGTWTYTDCIVRIATDNGIDVFDPANNSEQFCEVLAWLLSPALSLAHPEKAFFTVTSWNVLRSRFIDDCLEPVTMFSVGHNGTPAGIRAAVVEAAVRVANA